MNEASGGYTDGAPAPWPLTTLGKNLRAPIRNGYSPVCPANATGVWTLSLAAVTEHGFDPTGVKPAPVRDEKVRENMLVSGDLVVSRSNTPGRVGLAGLYLGFPESCSYPDLLMRVRPSRALDPDYLLAHLLSDRGRRFFGEFARGSSSSMVKIDRAILESFPIPLPPLHEQRAIAAALSDVDALIGALDRLVAKKRDLKQAAMQQLLTGQTRLPGFSEKAGTKQTEGGTIPEDWDALQIRSVCRLVNGRGFKPHEWESDGLPIIRIQNLNGSEDFNFFSGQYDPKILVEHGQLLFAWSGSRGTSFGPHVWRGGSALLNYHTWKVVVDESKVSPSFLLYALRQLTSYIEDRAHGASALVHTQKWEMEKFVIPIPSQASEQAAIASFLSKIDAELLVLEERRDKTRLLKQGMMQELLPGRIRLV